MKKIAFLLEVQGAAKSAADVVNLDKALDQNRKQLRKTRQEIKAYEKATKEQQAVLDKAGKSAKDYTEELKRLKGESAVLRESQRQATVGLKQQAREFVRVKKAIPKDSIVGLRLEYIKLTDQFNKLGKAQRNSIQGKKLAREARQISKELNKAGKSVGSFNNTVRNFQVAGKQLIAGLAGGAGIVGAVQLVGRVLRDAADRVIEFEKETVNLNAILTASGGAGDSAEELAQKLGQLSDQALQLGATTLFTSTQVVQLQTELARLGFTTDEILNSSKAIIDFSVATRAEVPRAAATAGAALRAFGLDSAEMTRILSTLAISTTRSALTFEKLEVQLPVVAAAAKAVNLSIEETTAQLGVLADNGVDSSTAATSLRNILLEAATQGVPYTELLEQINASSNKAAKALELFGKRGAVASLILAQSTERLADLEAGITDADDALEKLAEDQLTSLSSKLTLLDSQYDGLIKSIDDGSGAFTNFGKTVVTQITDGLFLLQKFNEGFITFGQLARANASNDTASLAARLREEDKITQKLQEQLRLRRLQDSARGAEIAAQGGGIPLTDAGRTNVLQANELRNNFANNPFLVTPELAKTTAKSVADFEREVANLDNSIGGLRAKQTALNATWESAQIGSLKFQNAEKELEEVTTRLNKLLGKRTRRFKEGNDAVEQALKGSLKYLAAQVSLAQQKLDETATAGTLRTPAPGTEETEIEALVKAQNEYNNYVKLISEVTEEFKRANLELLTFEERISFKEADIESRLEAERAYARLTIQDAEILQDELSNITARGAIDLYTAQLEGLEEGGTQYLKILGQIEEERNKITNNSTDIELTKLENALAYRETVISDSLRRAFTEENELQDRLLLLRLGKEEMILQKELELKKLSAKDELAITEQLLELQAQKRIAQAKVDLGTTDQSNLNANDRDQRILDLAPEFDPANVAASLEKLIEYERQKELIKAEYKLAELENELELQERLGNNTLELQRSIAEQEIEINALKNEKIIAAEQEAAANRARIQRKIERDLLKSVEEVGEALGTFVIEVGQDSAEAYNNLAKSIGGTIIDLIGQQLTLLAVQAFGQADSVASFGATGALRVAAITALMKGATSGLKAAVLGSFGEGGDLKEGGKFKGKSHKYGGIKFSAEGRVGEAESGEIIINKRSSAGHFDRLSAINELGGGKKISQNRREVERLKAEMRAEQRKGSRYAYRPSSQSSQSSQLTSAVKTSLSQFYGREVVRKYAQGDILGNRPITSIPQFTNPAASQALTARMSQDDMLSLATVLAEVLTRQQASLVTEVTDRVIDGVQEGDRLAERKSRARSVGTLS